MIDAQSKRRNEKLGRDAETWACRYLQLKFYRILARRLRTNLGEIDIIARRWQTLAFVEVKYRPDLTEGLWALQPHQKKRLIHAASFLAGRYARPRDTIRLDLIVVVPPLKIYHLKNVFSDLSETPTHAWHL